MPSERFHEECIGFADLKTNLYPLRRMTDMKLWLRTIEPEHELNPRYIERLCAWTEFTYVRILASAGR